MEVIVYWTNQNFSIQRHTEKQNKNKKLNVRRDLLNLKYLKIEEYVNIIISYLREIIFGIAQK